MRIILFFKPSDPQWCLRKLLSSVPVRLVENWGLRALIEVGEDFDPATIVESFDCVSRVAVVHAETADTSLESLCSAAVETSKLLPRGALVRVEARRWDKSYHLTSPEIARRVAECLEENASWVKTSPRANNAILVAVDRGRAFISYMKPGFEETYESISREVAEKVVVIAEGLETDYEIADLLQLSRALGFKLRLLNPSMKALEKALKHIGTAAAPEVVQSVDEALKGVETPIALSMYGRNNEKTLIKLVQKARGSVIGLAVGSERRDVSGELRDRCIATIRLGPWTGMPMRTSSAVAYALGLVLPILSGYIQH